MYAFYGRNTLRNSKPVHDDGINIVSARSRQTAELERELAETQRRIRAAIEREKQLERARITAARKKAQSLADGIDVPPVEPLELDPKMPLHKQIIKQVAHKYRLTEADLRSPDRNRYVVAARTEAIQQIWFQYRAAKIEISLPQIGRLFGGRDHTTVLHALKKSEQYRANTHGGKIVDEAS